MREEGREKEHVHVDIRRVLRSKTNIAIIAIWIITGIAIVGIFKWATGSPTLETLISADIGIGIAILSLMFSLGLKVFDKFSEMSNTLVRMETVLARIETSLRER